MAPLSLVKKVAATRQNRTRVYNMVGTPDVRWRQRFQSFREAFARGLIANGEEWMAMIQARNRSTHTYNEATAREIVAAIRKSFANEFAAFRTTFVALEAKEP